MNGAEIVKQQNVEEIIQAIRELPVDDKAQLVAEILGSQPGVSIVFGNGGNHVERADLVVQINNAEKEVIKSITDAIARRIEK
jgi:hypothetical protein